MDTHTAKEYSELFGPVAAAMFLLLALFAFAAWRYIQWFAKREDSKGAAMMEVISKNADSNNKLADAMNRLIETSKETAANQTRQFDAIMQGFEGRKRR